MRICHQKKEQASRHIDQGDPLWSGRHDPFWARRSSDYGESDATHAALLSWRHSDEKALRRALLVPPAVAEQAEATRSEVESRRGFGHLEASGSVTTVCVGKTASLQVRICLRLLKPKKLCNATVWPDCTTPSTSAQPTTTITLKNPMIPSSVRRCSAC